MLNCKYLAFEFHEQILQINQIIANNIVLTIKIKRERKKVRIDCPNSKWRT